MAGDDLISMDKMARLNGLAETDDASRSKASKPTEKQRRLGRESRPALHEQSLMSAAYLGQADRELTAARAILNVDIG